MLQVNTAGAERLYSLAGDWAGIGPETLLFDVCCGTGAIGLTLAKRVGMVQRLFSLCSPLMNWIVVDPAPSNWFCCLLFSFSSYQCFLIVL